MNGAIQTYPDQHRAEGILDALGAALPQGDLVKLRGFLAGEGRLDVSDDDARRIVDALKTAADRHWRIDPHRSVELADAIIAIDEARGDTWTRALGTMAKGDAIKFIGSQQEAWDLLEESARLFQSIGDEVGWARTWIGRQFVAAQLHRLPEAVEQANVARKVFERHAQTLLQMRIEWALGEANQLTDNLGEAETHYNSALTLALELGESGEHDARAIYNNLGMIAQERGDPQAALAYFDQVAKLARAHGKETDETFCRLNIATARMQLGQFRQALALLNEISPRYRQLFGADTQIHYEMAKCMAALNRNGEAHMLFQQARSEWLAAKSKLSAARTAVLEAMAKAGLGDFAGAQELLSAAEREFSQLGDTALTDIVQLRRGQLALRQGDASLALSLAQPGAKHFGVSGRTPYQAEALLLEGDAYLNLGQFDGAGNALSQALHRARACVSPALIYAAHLSLGRLAERQGRPERALRRYAAAEATLERMQRNLTIALRPAFLASKLEAQRARNLLLIQMGNVTSAFETVERVRAQIARGYLSGQESLRWTSNDPIAAGLMARLAALRGRHHALSMRTEELFDGPHSSGQTATREALISVERQMRALTEQLHLRRPSDAPDVMDAPNVAQLQAALDLGEAMIASFDDGARLRVFFIDRERIEQIALDADSAVLARMMDQLERNLARALETGGVGAAAAWLKPAQVILKRLWEVLFAPLMPLVHGKSRLFIVPFGQLHALPFNLLYNGERYQIELTEIVTLPSASLLLRSSSRQPAGALVLVHDDSGRLPDVERESSVIQALFPSEVRKGSEATRGTLQAPPSQILHIAAHGTFRTDNPDFSHVTLADGQMMIDDLLQMDLSYELVTLSACETGRGRVSAGDETLGIGWAFLYAGAGAVVSSLWRVSDERTALLMARLYGALHAGLSKPAALRRAQIEALAEAPGAHPAFWGAFQLVGSPAALSRAGVESSEAKAPHV